MNADDRCALKISRAVRGEVLDAKATTNVCEEFPTNWSPLSVSEQIAIPIRIIQQAKKKFAICFAFYLDIDIPRVSFEYRSVRTRTCWFLSGVFGNGPRILMATKPSGPEAGNSCKFC